jgi:putative flippase GtrA
LKTIFHHPIFRRHFSQGVKFVIVGGTAALIELVTVTLLVEALFINEQLAGALSLIPSVTFVYFTNKHFTFRAGKSRDPSEAKRFIAVYAAAIALNYILYSMFLNGFGFDYRLSKALAIGIIACWNYAWSHAFVFKRKHPDPAIGI